ncbi:MAG: ABC transporter ATP-binding protein [Chloroflexota bacterium]|jgi:cobalt/nickel transport system ATP-binding protein
MIEIEELTFCYPDGQCALSGVTLRVEAGERVALVGPNGAGKSTLLLHLNGILRATEGTIRTGGLALTDRTLGQIRVMVGLVFQNPDDQLFSPRVFEDVAFGPLHMGLPEDEVRERVQGALAAVGMSAYAGRVSYHLSLGEKKRIALATVLSMSPRILALDEPTAGLDPRARRSLIKLLQGLDGQTLLIASHDMRLVRDLCTRMVVLDGGAVVADGPTEVLIHDSSLLEQHGLESA